MIQLVFTLFHLSSYADAKRRLSADERLIDILCTIAVDNDAWSSETRQYAACVLWDVTFEQKTKARMRASVQAHGCTGARTVQVYGCTSAGVTISRV